MLLDLINKLKNKINKKNIRLAIEYCFRAIMSVLDHGLVLKNLTDQKLIR